MDASNSESTPTESGSRRPLNHFYHVYADGDWQKPIQEHLDALDASGLAVALDSFGVGIVGKQWERVRVIDFVNDRLPIDHLAETDDGWEQVTLGLMLERMPPVGFTFYGHTKTAANFSEMHDQWRRSMTYFNVIKWRDCVDRLADHETVGCHLIEPGSYWGGNYWWARNEWLRILPPLCMDSRYHAESWIGSGSGRRFDMNPGWPDPSRFITEW